MSVPPASTSVVIPSHAEDRFDHLVGAITSVRGQPTVPAEIVVVVDHNPTLFYRARRDLSDVTVLENRFEPGVSGTRNTGALHAVTQLVVFLDDDVTAHPGWLPALVAPLADPAVVGTGGAMVARWETRQPAWFPDEFLWAVGSSYAGMPMALARVRNVWSGSMAVRREAFVAAGGFRTDFGKVGNRSRPEDTELCLRLSRETGGHWVYVPHAVVAHRVPAQRATFGYFLTRCFNEGRGKVLMARLLAGAPSLDSERNYLLSTLPRAVLRGAAGPLRGRGLRPAVRSLAVLVGMAAAALGGLVELLAAALGPDAVASTGSGEPAPEPIERAGWAGAAR